MNDYFERLLLELNRRDILRFLPPIQSSEATFLFLLDALERRDLSQNQIRNALHVLYKLKGWGSEKQLLKIYIHFAHDERVKVRTEALTLVVAIISMHKVLRRQGELLSVSELTELRSVLSRGVEKKAEEYLKKYLGQFDE